MNHPPRRLRRMIGLASALLLLALGLSLGLPPRPSPASAESRGLREEFAAAAGESGVPEPLLMALAYMLSRWEQHGGRPSTSGGYGIMHLTDVDWQPPPDARGHGGDRHTVNGGLDELHTLDAAAALLGADPAMLRQDRLLNLRGGAALLAGYARSGGTPPARIEEWYGAVARYSGFAERLSAYDFADSVYATLREGASRTTSGGETLTLAPLAVTPDRAGAERFGFGQAPAFDADCPPEIDCEVVPAAYALNNPDDLSDYGNYDLGDRPDDELDIRYILIHDTEIPYTTTLRAFQNPLSYVSSHYVVRSQDGHIAQMVENNNVTWHAGNWYVNAHAIGLEHEGVAIQGAAWYTEYLYRASARLTRYLTHKYGIPRDRAHIVGHDEVPGPLPANNPGMHWDPGPFWDWAHYMELVQGDGLAAPEATPGVIRINPEFAANQPLMTYCYAANDCRDVPRQPANFVYLHTAPDERAPLITNQYVTAAPTRANNWANKAVTGQQFYRAGSHGDWDAIHYDGELAWFHNPGGAKAEAGSGLLVTPKAGLAEIPVYGRAYPEAAAYPPGVPAQAVTPIYQMPAGQIYVAAELFESDYYRAPTYTLSYDPSVQFPVIGETEYYQISYNHRFAFVKAADVEVVTSPGLLGLAASPPSETRNGAAGETVSHSLRLTNLGAVSATLSLSATGSLWGATLSQTSLALPPGASATVTLQVPIPAAPAIGTDTAQIVIRRADTPGKAVRVSRVTRLAGELVWLPQLGR